MSYERRNRLNIITSWNEYDSLIKETEQSNDQDKNDEVSKDHHDDCDDIIFAKVRSELESANRDIQNQSTSLIKCVEKKRGLDAIYVKIPATGGNDDFQDESHDDYCIDGNIEGVSKNRPIDFKFQWMRPNPAFYFQLASECNKKNSNKPMCGNVDVGNNKNDNWDIAAKVSTMVNIYEKKKSKEAKVKHVYQNHTSTSSSTSKDHLDKAEKDKDDDVKKQASLIQFPPLNVDLTKLIHPHLLSQWVPGVDMKSNVLNDKELSSTDGTSTARNNHATKNKNRKRPRNNGDKGSTDTNSYEMIFDNICYHVSSFITKKRDVIGKNWVETSANNITTMKTFLEGIKNIQMDFDLSIDKMKYFKQDDWIRILPSNNLIQSMKKQHEMFGCNGKVAASLRFSLLVLIGLVNLCHSKSLGNHVVQILCPSLFSISYDNEKHIANNDGGDQPTNASVLQQNDCSTDDGFGKIGGLDEEERKLMDFFASSLVQNCFGGNASKAELRQIMLSIGGDHQSTALSAFNELRHFVTIAFYRYHRKI